MNDPLLTSHKPLREVVHHLMQNYFLTLDGQPAQKLYEMVIGEVERGLFRAVLDHAGGNQSRAAEWLGLARNTLRKRLAEYGLDT